MSKDVEDAVEEQMINGYPNLKVSWYGTRGR